MAKRSREDARTFLISVAAELAGMHAQTLRTYDRLGLVSPERTSGGGRRYSQHDVELLREVQRLSQDEGVNLAGIKRIRELEDQVAALSRRVAELESVSLFPAPRLATTDAAASSASETGPSPLPPTPPGYRGDLLPALPSSFTTALAVWRPNGR